MSPIPTSAHPSSPSSPSSLLVLLAASILREHDRSLLPTPVADLAQQLGIPAERVSRLKSCLLPEFERLIGESTRPGRPSSEEIREVDGLMQRIGLLEELLALAGGALADVGVRGRTLQDRLVAAYEKLAAEKRITLSAFCSALKIPERTFREWVRRARETPAPSSSPPTAPTPSRKRRGTPRRGRFAPARTLPGLQVMADTTNTEVLSIPLKLVGTQDPGARDEELLADFSLSTNETADLVAETADRLLEKLPGLQFITDQGKPYMAKLVRDLCETREVEHAPTPEATPTAKATLERAFRTIKSAIAPLLELTRRIAEDLPELKDEDLAVSLGTLLFGVGLRIYNFASRERPSSEATRPAGPEAIAAVVEEQREKARSELHSRRLLLEKIHREYGMPGGQEDFIRRFRTHHLEDLREAMIQLSRVHCCCRIQKPDRYFAAILWRISSEGASRRSHRRRQVIERAEARRRDEEHAHERDWLEKNPAEWVLLGIDGIARQYRPELGDFSAGERVFGLAPLRRALEGLVGSTALSEVAIHAAWSRWMALNSAADPALVMKVQDVFWTAAGQVLATTPRGTGSPAMDLAELARSGT